MPKPYTNDYNIDLEYAREHMGNSTSSFFFGYSPAVATDTWEDIHPAGGDINWQTAAVTVSVSSTDANDTIAGSGCRQVEIHGLSNTGEDQSEVIDLSGTTEVDSVLTYRRVNKLHAEQVGTYGGSHEGNITARVDSAGAKTGAILSRMYGFEGTVDVNGAAYGSGEAGNGYWSVPLGKTMYVTDLTVDIDVTGNNKEATVILYEREGLLTTSGVMLPRRIIWDAQNSRGELRKTFHSYIKIKPLTDLWFRAVPSATAAISVSLDFLLVDTDLNGQ
jgi:hypothetical protein